jgi:hypothetical protein
VKGSPRDAARVRRSAHVVAYWRHGQLVIRNYATDTATRGNSLVFAVLEFCSEWRTRREIEQVLEVASPALVLKLVRRLTEQSLLER